jgi:Xaa-Pro aminopeptidase
MMDPKIYKERRNILAKKIGNGIILLAANKYLPRNYPSNSLPFRQDSSFLYYTGIDNPDIYCVIDCNSGDEILFGHEPTIEDTIWSGSLESLRDIAQRALIHGTHSMEKFSGFLTRASEAKRPIHYLPPYTADRLNEISNLLGRLALEAKSGISDELIRAVISQRIHKSEEEVKEIETALDLVTGPMHVAAMRMARADIYEYQIVAELYKLAKEQNMEMAYPVICSVRGEVLHNESHVNILKEDQFLLIDAGVESLMHYASDITRTTPVGGKFSDKQKEIYEIVLAAQLQALEAVKPGITYREVHQNASLKMAEGLKQIGLMKGDMKEAVQEGAHALFFPHGLGHMLGLDVHDMEDLGENLVGYGSEMQRSTQFGTAYLRLARTLEPGFLFTVEPGLYFIPNLIRLWESEKKFLHYINYSALEKYMNFGGVRIEDNVYVTRTGVKVLGKPIPKTVDEIEALS